MTKSELFKLNSKLAALHKRAADIESDVSALLNDLAAEHIPTAPELTEEATHQLKTNGFNDFSGAVDALMEIITKTEDKK